jgi:AcrR family transcriptional regulator
VPSEPKGPRQINREQVTADIMDAARRQLADVGAAALSLRSVAREIGMVSSAVYRYVASRDDLLTRLIIEAYDALGAVAERALAESTTARDAERWLAVAHSIRGWALDHPHEYVLIYGSPVPGYAAPQDTVVPGTRVTLALVSVVRDAAIAGRLDTAAAVVAGAAVVDDRLGVDLDRLAEFAAVPLEHSAMVAFFAAWTQLFGLISFELTNQTRGMVDDHAALFDATARLGAGWLGLR